MPGGVREGGCEASPYSILVPKAGIAKRIIKSNT
jgi:hypothetical protein